MGKRWLSIMMIAGILMLLGVRETALPADGSAEISEVRHYLALTFDDGPRPGTTDRLLDGLKQQGASATFFLVGEQAALYPDLVKRMEEEGHQVGNHTWSHVRLEGEDEEMLRQEIENTEILLGNILGGSNYWLRSPYGFAADTVTKQVEVPMVKWSVDPRDWESRDAEKIFRAVLGAVKPNSIILLHDIYEPSVNAALRLVETLQEQGYLFVTVEELLRLNGVVPEAGVLYRTGLGA